MGSGDEYRQANYRGAIDLAVKAIEQTCRPLIEERHKTRRNGFV